MGPVRFVLGDVCRLPSVVCHLSDERLPSAIGVTTGCYVYPVESPGSSRRPDQHETGLGRRPSALARVAPLAGSHDVLPNVLPPLNLRDDVIDVLSTPTAVLAPMIVTEEDGSSRDRHRSLIRYGHVSAETNHRWHSEGHGLCVPRAVAACNEIGALAVEQHDGASSRHHRQWLVARVEDQRSHHDRISVPPAPGKVCDHSATVIGYASHTCDTEQVRKASREHRGLRQTGAGPQRPGQRVRSERANPTMGP